MCKPLGTGQWQLFNLKDDPGVTRDHATEKPDISDKLVKHWDAYVRINEVILPEVSPLCGKDYAG